MQTITAVNPTTGNQTTEYMYGVSTATGSAIDSNDIVSATRHPDPTTGAASSSEEESTTVDALGRTITATDRNGTEHEYTFDALGRFVSDEVTTLGSGVDGSVMKREVAYDGQGNAYLFTSRDGNGAVVNEVLRQFDGFGNVTREYQEANGAVTGSTKFVKYDYTVVGNSSHLTKITYPDGYEVDYNYATGVDSNISRLTSISDATGTLEAYSYQGDGTVLTVDRTQPGVTLTKTLDDFGRVIDFNWSDGVNSVVHYEYGYDANSNVLYKEDLVNSGLSELYGYDALNQIATMARGTLNGGKTAITGTPDFEQSWNHDALGNWDDVTTNGGTEDRNSNAQNEYTDVDGNSPAYDANGNMTTDQDGKQFVRDAWNRLVEVQDASSATLRTYTYDSLNRRVTSDDGTTVTNLYYSVGWQVLQEQVAGDVSQQYVYSATYPDAMILRDRDTNNDGIVDERLWVIQDNNFNVMALVDDTGAVVERYKYTAFGVATIMDASYTVLGSSAHAWVHLHQGLRLEEASGLYDNRWRWYSAELGQFVSNDPIGFNAGDVNVRRYVGNGAVGAVDPSGLDMIFLYDREAAAGHGHAAILIMNQKGGWDYYSFAPAGKGSAVVSGLFFDVPVNEELFHIHFDSLIDAWKSDLLARYDKYIRYSADELDESLARKACEKYRGKDFAITNNCMNMTGSALKAARIDIDIRPIGDQHTDASGAGHVLLNDKDKKRLDTCASPMNTHARASKFGGRVQNADVWGFGKVGYNPGKEFNNPYYIRPLTGQFDKASTILVCP